MTALCYMNISRKNGNKPATPEIKMNRFFFLKQTFQLRKSHYLHLRGSLSPLIQYRVVEQSGTFDPGAASVGADYKVVVPTTVSWSVSARQECLIGGIQGTFPAFLELAVFKSFPCVSKSYSK